ncbi:MAG: class I SAM-dependent DNA methyltransferase [Erysipelotrichaceae bacterium]|uniref:type I restriction-modification system subunit M n=1 Tax=Floccifex sp. TaxID=2815810 RepID=UPI002A755A03|nr:class I SAM-dependent DNA methyltransferase [Floccifex sp.]MDD7282126.1 class I SAM-dependent DNA methyltransferase [Erysipelotrichaceae bacterium]MDY2958390.1 class I SAM-dependent DNA methyltransferase [Floccifex sp.]
MVTGELKSKIDKIWDTIWTAGISSPITVLEQITYLMFMKLLDDAEIKKEGNAAFLGVSYQSKVFKNGNFSPDEDGNRSVPYEDLRWHNFKNIGTTEMFELVRNYVFPFIKTVNGDSKESAFSRFMADAVFLIPTAKVLGVCVDTLSEIDMSNKDIMGDVYEYSLDKMSSAGQLGQFRTPRHIIDMMVQLVEPTLEDTILDPAMGSAGFLLSSAHYVSEKYKKELMKKENKKHFSTTMFTGFDTDPSMLRIGAMNMLLHGVDDPHIERLDSLSGDNQIRNQYSLIMANPPFTGSVFQEDISKDILSLCSTKKTELLFLALFIKMLKVGGRCACIVPDGVLFGSSKAHKSIRKELVENNRLQAVISMPSGVFKPYAGVSTAILIFTKDPSGTKDVWFYDMKADGYSLDDKRSQVSENDIPDIIERYHNLDKEVDRKRTEQSFFVTKQEIVDNGYDLSINKYKEIEYVPVEYPPTSEILDEIFKLDEEINKELLELKELLKND